MLLARVPALRLKVLRFPPKPRPVLRTLSTSGPPRARLFTLRRAATAGLVSSAIGATLYLRAKTPIHADNNERLGDGTAQPSLTQLVRTYVVYSLCSIPALVDWSPAILSTLSGVPVIKQITEAVVRVTFFDQFVGGDAAEDALPVLEQLRAANKGALFVYSVEVDETETPSNSAGAEAKAAHKRIVEETLHCLDVAAAFEDKYARPGHLGRGTWMAIKLSAMVPDAESLRRLSKHLVNTRRAIKPRIAFPGCPTASDLDILSGGFSNDILTDEDIAALRELREDLTVICERARVAGIRITVDAEHSWYQPAIDAFALDMMRRFNKLPKPRSSFWFGSRAAMEASPATLQPLVYNTFQGYLRRTPEYLTQSVARARAEGFALGVKLVRGAYHGHEIEVHKAARDSRETRTTPAGSHALSISPDNLPPVWLAKDETDTCYDDSVRTLLALVREDVGAGKGRVAAIGALFGTHNWASANLVVDEMVKLGLATHEQDDVVRVGDAAMQRVAVAQLYGMSDELSDHLVRRARSSSPFVLKYLPYGSLIEVMPYLSRRAIENKSVLGNGGAAAERKRAASAIVSRLFG